MNEYLIINGRHRRRVSTYQQDGQHEFTTDRVWRQYAEKNIGLVEGSDISPIYHQARNSYDVD